MDFILDSMKVMNYLQKGSNVITEFDKIMYECRHHCNFAFKNSLVEFSRRKTNQIAHALALCICELKSNEILQTFP